MECACELGEGVGERVSCIMVIIAAELGQSL